MYKDGYGGCQLEDFTLEWLGGRLALGETQVSVCNSLFQRETVQILQRRISRSPSRGRVVVGECDGHIQLLVLFTSGERRTRGSKFRHRRSAALHCPYPSPWQFWSSLELLQSSRGQTVNVFASVSSVNVLICAFPWRATSSITLPLIFSLLLFTEISHLLMSPFPLSLPVVNWLC